MPDETPAPEPAEVTPPPEPMVIPEAEPAETPAPEVPDLPAEASAEAGNPAPEMPQPPFDVAQGKEAEMTQMGGNESFSPKSESLPPTPPAEAPANPAPAVFAPILNSMRDLADKARTLIQDRKRKKLEKILALLDTKKNISSEDVQKLLRVSRQTAVRYLNQLEKEGEIVQVGAKGRGVLYVKAN